MTTTPHQYLQMHKYHLSVERAESRILDLLKAIYPKANRASLRGKTITLTTDKGETQYEWSKLVMEARLSGTVASFRAILDAQDPLFGSKFGFASNIRGLKFKIEWAGFEKELEGPQRQMPIEMELASDIEYYRRLTCESSGEHDFELTGRHYRAFLYSSVSLIEAFLNLHIYLAKAAGTFSEDQERQWISSNFDARLELWFSLFAPESPNGLSELKKSTSWGHFQELRAARNRIVHSAEPYLGFEVRAFERGLNLVQSGVGEFLHFLRRKQNRPTLGIIERLESSPRVKFVPRSSK